MPDRPVVLVGLGFTASRLARRLVAEGRRVHAAVRKPERFAELISSGVMVREFVAGEFPRDSVVVYTVPPVDEPDQTRLHNFLVELHPVRVVYVSATSVYGELGVVDGGSPAVPSTVPGFRRFDEERWMEAGRWESLILRAAAIYGPGRGAHRRVLHSGIPADSQRRGPSGVVSRIHTDDLAALARAGLDSELTGAFPVADELPCSTASIMRWSAVYLGIDPALLDLSGPATTGRHVDGATIVRRLGVALQFPDYRTGIPHCLQEEGLREESV